jgi:hypothetical protein
MQSNDIMTDKVVPWSDIGRDPNGCNASGHKIILYPFGIVGFPADLVNLEPLSVSLVELVASNGSTRSHICQHGSNVVRPLAITSSPPVKSDNIAWICVSNESSWTGIGTACKSRVVGTLIRILRADLPNDARVGGPTCTVALENFALDGNPPQDTVGRHIGSGQERSEDECGELHCIARVEGK